MRLLTPETKEQQELQASLLKKQEMMLQGQDTTTKITPRSKTNLQVIE